MVPRLVASQCSFASDVVFLVLNDGIVRIGGELREKEGRRWRWGVGRRKRRGMNKGQGMKVYTYCSSC